MFPIHTILFPTDFSQCSRQVFQVARALAHCFEARLIVAHVAPTGGAHAELYGAGSSGTWEYAWSLRDMRELYQAPELRRPLEHRLRTGEIVAELLRESQSSKIDLIVMGSRAHDGPGPRLVGSIAEGVLRGARCPVLTIKTASVPAPDLDPDHHLVGAV